MANAHIQLPADSTGKMLATDTWVNGEAQTVHGQNFVLYGPDGTVISRQASGSKNAIDVNIAASKSGQAVSSQVISATTVPATPNTANTTSTCVAAVGDQGNVTFTISGGSFTGSFAFVFEASDDGGTTWFGVQCIREDGVVAAAQDMLYASAGAPAPHMWTTAIPGFTHFRVRCVALPGTLTTGVTVRITPGPSLVEFTPQVSAAPVDGGRKTYSVATPLYTAVASTADFLELQNLGVATLVRVTAFSLWVISSTTTAIGNAVIAMFRRGAHDSAGTSIALNGSVHDSVFAASAAKLLSYTAAPTLGTGGTNTMRTYGPNIAASTGARVQISDTFGNRPSMAEILHPGESLVWAFQGAPAAAPSIMGWVEWTEETW